MPCRDWDNVSPYDQILAEKSHVSSVLTHTEENLNKIKSNLKEAKALNKKQT